MPGDYAAAEAMKALRLGLNVMLFSDNVALEDEASLKRHAKALGLLVMGPDCGTAIIDGVPLGFANAVRRGAIGVVGASGTGTQQVTSLVHRRGAGISHAIGTGGHDLHRDVGGSTMLQGLDAMVIDLQDIGARFYTYITTMAYVMEEAAKSNLPVYVLDRPNPINGFLIEGPALDKGMIEERQG